MTKKTVLAALVALALAVGTGHAQKAELGVYAGYMFGGTLQAIGGDLTINDSWAYSATLDITLKPGAQIELLYIRQPTKLQANPVGFPKQDVFDMVVSYYHIGVISVIDKGVAKPFGGFTAGVTNYNPDSSAVSSETRFSVMLQVGVKVQPTQRLGLRAQFRLPMTFFSTSVGLGCGGAGCSGVIGGWGILQGEISGGAYLAF